jgi:serine phosphatase RsbU (regulator of sigma subunit)
MRYSCLKAVSLLIVISLFTNIGKCQYNRVIDSIFVLINQDKHQEKSVIHYNKISDEFRALGQMDSCLKYGLISYRMAKRQLAKKPCNKTYISEYTPLANVCGSLGTYYNITGNYPKSLEYYFEGLKIDELTGNKSGRASRLGNIGNIYLVKSEFKKALEYYFRSLNIAKEQNEQLRMSIQYGNIGIVYDEMATQANKTKAGSGDSLYTKALDFYFKALEISQKLNIKSNTAIYLGNIGTVYEKRNENEKALDYFFKALALAQELGDKAGSVVHLGNIGSAYMASLNYAKAEKYLNDALNTSIEISAINDQRLIEELLSELYTKQNRFELALEHFKASMALKDTIFNQEKENEATRKELNYEFEKKQAAQKAEQEKKDAIKAAESRRQKVILWSVAGGLALAMIFALFVFRSLRITNKQKRLIEIQKNEVLHQKKIVDENQKEIIDSITYAKRLQEAILPPEELVTKYTPQNFILYKPKAIVAGDFYWMEERSGTVFIAVADCTGHGVPGAMVSVVCSNALNRALKEFNLSYTGEILDKVADLVIETFAKSDKEVKDGMDISLLAINKTTKKVQWSGANNPLWYVQKNKLIEIKADKQPIGKSDNRVNFKTHEILYDEGTTFYLFTDGYADQFGGERGKKFMYKQLQELLISGVDEPLKEQKERLNLKFEQWCGNLEQVDDVCIIGLRI